MKKIYTISAAMVLSLAVLSGCGSNNETEGSAGASTEASVSSDAASTEASTIDISGLEIKTLADFDVDKLVQLGAYTGNTLEATKREVTDADVEDSLNGAYSMNPYMKDVTDRAVEDGDTVNIDYVGVYADTKEAFQGGTRQGASLGIGSGRFIQGFESGLIGVNAGETVDLNLTFPEDYSNADLAGKDVIFTVTVNKIQVADKEPSDEWVKSLGLEGVETLEDYRKSLREELEADAEEEYKATLMNSAIEAAVDNATVDNVPKELYNRYYKMIYESVENYLQQMAIYGVQGTVDEYLSNLMQNNGISGTPDDYLSDIANQQSKRSMVIQAIANKEGIEVSEQEIDDYIRTDYDAYNSQFYGTFEEFKETVDVEGYREALVTDKVAEFLMNNSTVVPASE